MSDPQPIVVRTRSGDVVYLPAAGKEDGDWMPFVAVSDLSAEKQAELASNTPRRTVIGF